MLHLFSEQHSTQQYSDESETANTRKRKLPLSKKVSFIPVDAVTMGWDSEIHMDVLETDSIIERFQLGWKDKFDEEDITAQITFGGNNVGKIIPKTLNLCH